MNLLSRPGSRALALVLACVATLAVTLGTAVPAEAARLNLHRGSSGAKVRLLETRLHRLGLLTASAAYAAVLEFDLRLTKDHQVVLMHDVTLDRTTNCSGRVIDWSLAALKQLCSVSGQPIPTFDEVAAYAETLTLKIAPEIKNADIS